jgi:hypothetical protein
MALFYTVHVRIYTVHVRIREEIEGEGETVH